jgi:hypothetical protein
MSRKISHLASLGDLRHRTLTFTCTRAHRDAGLTIKEFPAHADARDHGARPVHDDPAPHGWCSWPGWGSRRICEAGALESCEHPAGVLALHVQDAVLHLEGKLIRVAIGTPAPVGQPLNPAFLVAVEDFVAGLAGIPNSRQSSTIASPASRRAPRLQSLMHYRTLLPQHHFLPKTEKKCNLCVR